MENKLISKEKNILEIIIKKKIASNHKIHYPINCFLFILIFLILKIESKILLNSDSEIRITIKGTGNQSILFTEIYFDSLKEFRRFSYIPTQIYINGILQNYTGTKVYNLEN